MYKNLEKRILLALGAGALALTSVACVPEETDPTDDSNASSSAASSSSSAATVFDVTNAVVFSSNQIDLYFTKAIGNVSLTDPQAFKIRTSRMYNYFSSSAYTHYNFFSIYSIAMSQSSPSVRYWDAGNVTNLSIVNNTSPFILRLGIEGPILSWVTNEAIENLWLYYASASGTNAIKSTANDNLEDIGLNNPGKGDFELYRADTNGVTNFTTNRYLKFK